MFHSTFPYSRAERRVIEQAARVIAEGRGHTMQEIADISGIGRTTLYRHFRTREDLVQAIKALALEEARAAIETSRLEEGSAGDALRRVIAALFSVGDRYQILAEEAMHGDHSHEEKQFLGEKLYALVQRGQREGEFASTVSAQWILGAMAGLLLTALRQVQAGDLARNHAPILVADTLLNGIKNRASQE